jgi:FkbM family methyltransferase
MSAIDLLLRLRRSLAEMLGSDRYSHQALNELDRKLRKYIDYEDGVFVEAGANDGISQSNTYWFERFRGWRGVLIEGVPRLADACRRNRPNARVYNAALVGDPSVTRVAMRTAHLMSLVSGAFGSRASDDEHLRKGAEVQRLRPGEMEEVEVPARTLTSILAEVAPLRLDLLSLDVEGYEAEALRGLDLNRFRPRYVLVEVRSLPEIDALLGRFYDRVDQLSHHDYLYALKDNVC